LPVGRTTAIAMIASKYCFHLLGFHRVNKNNSHRIWLGYTSSFAWDWLQSLVHDPCFDKPN
jgi:hypothetical protein